MTPGLKAKPPAAARTATPEKTRSPDPSPGVEAPQGSLGLALSLRAAPGARSGAAAGEGTPVRGASGAVIQRKCATCAPEEEPPVQRKCAECAAAEAEERRSGIPQPRCAACAGKEEEAAEGVMRRADPAGAGPAHGAGPAVRAAVGAGGGRPLEGSTRAYFEAGFGRELGGVRIHTGGDADRSARAVGALAYATGRDVVFRAGYYAPGTREGRTLLAHELAHVVQQEDGARGVQGAGLTEDAYEAEADRAAERVASGREAGRLTPYRGARVQRKEGVRPPPAVMRGSLANFQFSTVKSENFQPGDLEIQNLAVILSALLGAKYPVGLAEDLYPMLKPPDEPLFINPRLTEESRNRPIPTTNAPPAGVRDIIALVEFHGHKVSLPADKAQLLRLGAAAHEAFEEVTGLPAWFSKGIFLSMLASHAGVLRGYATASESDQPAERAAAAEKIRDALLPAARALDAVRADPELTGHAVYKQLWGEAAPAAPQSGGTGPTVNPSGGGAKAGGAVAPPDRVPDLRTAVGVMTYAATRQDLVLGILGGEAVVAAPARRELLDAFEAYRSWLPAPTKAGDQELSEAPPAATVPAYPATLSAHPPIDPPLFDASTGAEYFLSMRLQFPSIWLAFQLHDYRFERIRVPDKEVIGAAERLGEMKGEETSGWSTLKGRLARDTRYNKEDLGRYIGNLGSSFGPPGVSVEAFGLNALLRYTGSIVSTGIQGLADPSWTTRLRFPEEGLYVVRARAAAYSQGKRFNRAPSVAYLPVFARSPEVLAESKLQQELDFREEAKRRKDEIQEKLKDPNVADSDKLREELAELRAATGSAFELLHFQRLALVRRKSDKKNPPSARELEQITERIEKIDQILEVREKRGLGAAAERLPTSFVGDSGQVLQLLIEVKQLDDGSTSKQKWLVADSTTPKGSMETGEGDTRDAAIRDGLKKLLEKGGYGRGQVSVAIDKGAFSMRIAASSTALLNEALTNASLVLAIVAVAAAPFTGGGSLVLLIPAGVVGAIPSAYRLIERGIDKTFRLDLEAALDIVNIVGAVVGLGAEAQLAKRSIWLGGALLVTGIGAGGTGIILMGAQLMEQIKALDDLPPDMRAAAMMEIMGHAMLQAGIMIGGLLAARSRLKATERAVGESIAEPKAWFESLTKETQEALEAKPTAKQFYMKMKPLVRELLTQCGSFCVQMDPLPTQAELAMIEKIALKLPSSGDIRWFKGMLHDNRGPGLGKLLKPLAQMKDGNQIASMLRSLTDPASVVLTAFSEQFKTPEVKAKAAALVNAGKIPVERIGAIMDKVRTTAGGDALTMLGYLEKLGEHQPPGWLKVLGELETGGNIAKGARWVLKFITESGLWEKVKAFEVEAEPGGRRWDVNIGGQLFQFKSWTRFWEATFVRQILEDFRHTAGFTDRTVKWAFEPGLGTAAEIVKMMSDSLDRAAQAGLPGYSASTVATIKAALPGIVEVGIRAPTK